MKMIPLGTIVTDSATGLKGMLTHMQVEQDHRQFYAFQPRGLRTDTGSPLPSTWIVAERVKEIVSLNDTDVPLSVLGSKATDEASGFSGMIISITLHISGCVHVLIQPTGKTKNGEIIGARDFDLRRCTGKAIRALSESERTASEKQKPSPSPLLAHSPSTTAGPVRRM